MTRWVIFTSLLPVYVRSKNLKCSSLSILLNYLTLAQAPLKPLSALLDGSFKEILDYRIFIQFFLL